MWPMLEREAVAYLRHELGVKVATNIPSDVEDLPGGFVRVTLGPGSDDGITDSPILDVEAFHVDRAAAWALAESARQALLQVAGRDMDTALMDRVATSTSPNFVYYGPNIERYVATYRVDMRRPVSTN